MTQIKMSREDALQKIEELKAFVAKEEAKSEVKLEIKSWSGRVCFSSTKATIREAVIEAVESGADLSEADLREANLIGADLSRANLSRADLSEADLSRANLSGANLSEANLSKVDLSGANLRGAEMQNAKFYGKTSNPKLLEQNQVDDFLAALGFKINK